MSKPLPFALLKNITQKTDCQGEEEAVPYCTHRVETAVEAITLVAKATRVFAVVLLAPNRTDWFQVPREEALTRLQNIPNDAKIICTRDSDGWCWLGMPGRPANG